VQATPSRAPTEPPVAAAAAALAAPRGVAWTQARRRGQLHRGPAQLRRDVGERRLLRIDAHHGAHFPWALARRGGQQQPQRRWREQQQQHTRRAGTPRAVVGTPRDAERYSPSLQGRGVCPSYGSPFSYGSPSEVSREDARDARVQVRNYKYRSLPLFIITYAP
jgi:hypothetical protein